MKKAVFMLQDKNWEFINKIYNRDSLDRIKEYASVYPELISRESLQIHREVLKDTEIVFSTWGMTDLSEEEIQRYLPKLKAVFYGAGTVQGFARPFLNQNITVVSAWAANAVPVAEYTLAQILLANKGFFQNVHITKNSYEAARDYTDAFAGNYSVKVGILGAGMIGTKVIELLKPFNVEVLVYDPFLPEDRAETLGVRKCTMAEIFSECQTISNHIANLPTTQGIINCELFDKMLPNATFINTGRGAQLVERDLIKALKEMPARTAVLDVTDPEPPVAGSELFDMKNVILTSHIAGSMGREVERLGCYMADEFIRYVNGKELKYGVALKMLETMA